MSDEENPPRNSAIASEHYPLTNRSTANELENASCNLSQYRGLNCSTRQHISIIEEFREENDANQMRATMLTRELNHAAISRDFKLKRIFRCKETRMFYSQTEVSREQLQIPFPT